MAIIVIWLYKATKKIYDPMMYLLDFQKISAPIMKNIFFSICAASYYNRRVDCILIRGWISYKLLGPKILQELLGVTAPTYTIDMQRESIRILLKLSTYTYVSFNIIVHGKIILKH